MENIIIAIVVIGAIILAVRHFRKGKCDCCKDDKCAKRRFKK